MNEEGLERRVWHDLLGLAMTSPCTIGHTNDTRLGEPDAISLWGESIGHPLSAGQWSIRPIECPVWKSSVRPANQHPSTLLSMDQLFRSCILKRFQLARGNRKPSPTALLFHDMAALSIPQPQSAAQLWIWAPSLMTGKLKPARQTLQSLWECTRECGPTPQPQRR